MGVGVNPAGHYVLAARIYDLSIRGHLPGRYKEVSAGHRLKEIILGPACAVLLPVWEAER